MKEMFRVIDIKLTEEERKEYKETIEAFYNPLPTFVSQLNRLVEDSVEMFRVFVEFLANLAVVLITLISLVTFLVWYPLALLALPFILRKRIIRNREAAAKREYRI